MSFFSKILNNVMLSDEDQDEDYTEYEEDYEEEEKKGFFSFGKKKKDEDTVEDTSSRFTSMRGGKSSSSVQVCIIKAQSSNDFREIADSLLSNNIIILDVEGMPHDEAQRIIDFMIGACYAIDGNLQKINNYIFIITPHAVSLQGDVKGLVEAFEGARMASGSLQTFQSKKRVGVLKY